MSGTVDGLAVPAAAALTATATVPTTSVRHAEERAPAPVDAGAADIGPGFAPAGPTPRPARRRISARPTSDRLLTLACAVNSGLVMWLLFDRLTDGVGWLGFLLCWFAGFLALQYVCVREQEGAAAAADRVASTVIGGGTAAIVLPFGWLLGYIVSKGLPALHWGFFVHDQRGVPATASATAGGASHAIVGSLEQVGLALLVTVPLSLLTAAFLNDTRSRWRRPVRVLVDAMSGLPSIVAGLFIYAIFIIPFAKKTSLFGFNGFMACLALSITMLPTITRTVEVVLRLVPDGLRESALALGASRARMVWSVVLPTARTGVTTSVVLGIARAVGETAPLLFTSFGLDLMNANPFRQPQESLPLFVYRNIQKPSLASIDRAFTGALVLVLVVVGLFTIARTIGRDRSGRRTRRAGRSARQAATSAPTSAPTSTTSPAGAHP